MVLSGGSDTMSNLASQRLKLSQLRAFVAVSESGNFGEAALQLGVSQSAISHAIATLEEELGLPLLLRGRHGAHLTVAGEQALQYVRQSLQLLESMVQKVNAHKGLQGGHLRIAAFRSVATHLLPEIIMQFQRCFPKIGISITEHFGFDEVEQDLKNRQADIGFTCFPTQPAFEAYPLYQDDYVVLLPPAAKSAAKSSPPGLSWEQLAKLPWISLNPGNACHHFIQTHLEACNAKLQIAYTVREDSTMVNMVAQGLGFAILPRLAAEPIPSTVQVCPLPQPLQRTIAAVVLADVFHLPAVFAFLETLSSLDRAVQPKSSRYGKLISVAFPA